MHIKDFIKLDLSTGGRQSVALAFLGTIATFTGFAVVFIQLSFDNYKKYYGSYSKILLFKSLGAGILYIFFLNIIFDIICAVSSESTDYSLFGKNNIHLQELSFYLCVAFFVLFLIVLIYKIKYIFDYSLSNNDLQSTIESITLKDAQEIINNLNNRNLNKEKLKNFEDNPIEVTTEVLLNFIVQNNSDVSKTIIKIITQQFQNIILNDKQDTRKTASEIAIVYCRMMHKVIELIKNHKFKVLFTPFYEYLTEFNKTISLIRGNNEAFLELIYLIETANKEFTTIDKSYSFSGLECYKNILLSHIIYNSPHWNDLQTGSPSIHSRRAYVFANTRRYLNNLWHYSTVDFNNKISDTIQKDLNSDEIYSYLSIHKDFIINAISYNCSIILSHYLLEKVNSNNLIFYKEALKKLNFENIRFNDFNSSINNYSPIHLGILSYLLNYDNKSSMFLLDSYLDWCSFVLTTNKNKYFISKLVEESTTLLYTLIIRLNFIKEKNEQTQDNIKYSNNLQVYIEKIINFYFNFKYDKSENSRGYISEINNRFWNFKEFSLKDVPLPDDLFLNKIDQIISNTVWANTFPDVNTPSKMKINPSSPSQKIIKFLKIFFS